jgi:hypothetical protein
MNKQAVLEQIREEAFRNEMEKVSKYLLNGSSYSKQDFDDRINTIKKDMKGGLIWPLKSIMQRKLDKAIELKNYYYGNE